MCGSLWNGLPIAEPHVLKLACQNIRISFPLFERIRFVPRRWTKLCAGSSPLCYTISGHILTHQLVGDRKNECRAEGASDGIWIFSVTDALEGARSAAEAALRVFRCAAAHRNGSRPGGKAARTRVQVARLRAQSTSLREADAASRRLRQESVSRPPARAASPRSTKRFTPQPYYIKINPV